MVKVKFYDLEAKTWRKAGEVMECNNERGEQLTTLGFAELTTEQVKPKAKPKDAKKD